jgi:hypothetical protein
MGQINTSATETAHFFNLNKLQARLYSRYELAGEEINCLFLSGIRRLFIRSPVLKPVATPTVRRPNQHMIMQRNEK